MEVESSALLLLSIGVAVLQLCLQEHSTECSMMLRIILVSAKDLQKSLEHANISIDESTICKTLNKNGVHWRTPRKNQQLSKKNIAAHLKFAKVHLDVPQHHSATSKIFCGQMKLQLSCLEGTHNTMCGEKKAQHTNIKPSSQL